MSRGARLREDTAIGVVFAGMFALGIALISTVRSYSVDLTHFLFGDVLGVGSGDLVRIAVFGGLILLAVGLLYKELTLLAFDGVLATTLRLPVRALEYLLLVLIAVAVVVSIQTVGVSLMLAVLVTPPATASLLTRRLAPMIALAAGMAAVCGVLGLYLSYYLGIASGAAIVLTCTAVFALAWAWSHLRAALPAAKAAQGV
jgi:manganese/iron transport system permease protein